MGKKRRQYSADDTFKIVLESVKMTKTVREIASDIGGGHPNQISQRKGHLLSDGQRMFQRAGDRSHRRLEQREARLYEQIGCLKMEREWLKKGPDSIEAKRAMLEPSHPHWRRRRMCALIGLPRATY